MAALVSELALDTDLLEPGLVFCLHMSGRGESARRQLQEDQ